MKLKIAKKSITKAQGYILFGMNFNASHVRYIKTKRFIIPHNKRIK